MKSISLLLLLVSITSSLFAQNNGKPDVLQKANNTVNKVSTIIAVFQPYLLKAREIYYDTKQLVSNAKNSAKGTFGNNNSNNNNYNNGYSNNNSNYSNSNTTYSTGNNGNVLQSSVDTSAYARNNQVQNNNNQVTYSNNNNTSQGGNMGYNNASQGNNTGYGNSIQNYLPTQSLPVNNNASINNDGTGNWGNQNNGLYGNCLDALTGTVMGMGDAAQTPTSVDLMFFAPTDGQNTYVIMTPGFARNNSTATYMTEHTSDQVMQWSDVNETEVALTKLTLGQFEKIQNNGQIQSAVRNAQDYSGYYTSLQKMDGQVLAVKAQMENREVYALIAIVKQVGTSGSNGYLKIMIKAQGIDNNNNGQINTNAYIR